MILTVTSIGTVCGLKTSKPIDKTGSSPPAVAIKYVESPVWHYSMSSKRGHT